MAGESDKGLNNHFNISTPIPTSVIELVDVVWNIVNPGKKLSIVSDKPYENDVQVRIPDVTKAEEVLGFKAVISLEESVREVIEYLS